MSPPFDLAIVGLSARALAQSAHRAGLRALALDLFGDLDTREYAAESIVLRRRGGLKIDGGDLIDQLSNRLNPGTPVVLGTGFEHRRKLVERLSERFNLSGSGAATLRQLKQPDLFNKLLTELDIPHPLLFAGEAPESVDALEKRIGGAGGHHIHPARRVRDEKHYLQQRLEGRSVSALFLGNGADSHILGFSEQWCDPITWAPFRYGGAVGPISLDAETEIGITVALHRLVASTDLKGLASADFIVNAAGWYLLEINPRPGASLDIFDHLPMPPLIRLHLDACEGRLPSEIPGVSSKARAACLFYAPTPFTLPDAPLPDWTADRPKPGTRFDKGDPVCTMLATGPSTQAARTLVQAHANELARVLGIAL